MRRRETDAMKNGRAARECAADGCRTLVTKGSRCDRHVTLAYQQAAKNERGKRGTRQERGYDSTWMRLRQLHISSHPLCKHCEERGRIVVGEEVDHIIPHRGSEALRLEPSNLQTLCKPCHSRKTASEDGGFGRAVLAR